MKHLETHFHDKERIEPVDNNVENEALLTDTKETLSLDQLDTVSCLIDELGIAGKEGKDIDRNMQNTVEKVLTDLHSQTLYETSKEFQQELEQQKSEYVSYLINYSPSFEQKMWGINLLHDMQQRQDFILALLADDQTNKDEYPAPSSVDAVLETTLMMQGKQSPESIMKWYHQVKKELADDRFDASYLDQWKSKEIKNANLIPEQTQRYQDALQGGVHQVLQIGVGVEDARTQLLEKIESYVATQLDTVNASDQVKKEFTTSLYETKKSGRSVENHTLLIGQGYEVLYNTPQIKETFNTALQGNKTFAFLSSENATLLDVLNTYQCDNADAIKLALVSNRIVLPAAVPFNKLSTEEQLILGALDKSLQTGEFSSGSVNPEALAQSLEKSLQEVSSVLKSKSFSSEIIGIINSDPSLKTLYRQIVQSTEELKKVGAPLEAGIGGKIATHLIAYALGAATLYFLYSQFKEEVTIKTIKPLEKREIEKMMKLVTAEQYFTETKSLEYLYTKWFNHEKDDMKITELSKSAIQMLIKDEQTLEVSGRLQVSYDLQESFSIEHVEATKTVTITLPPVQVTPYLTDVDLEIQQSSLASRLLPSSFLSDLRQGVVQQGVDIVKDDALKNNHNSVNELVKAAQEQATEMMKMMYGMSYPDHTIIVKFSPKPLETRDVIDNLKG